MSLLDKIKKINENVLPKKKPYEEKANLERLSLYFTIVNYGVGKAVMKLFDSMGVSMQMVQMAEGTANKEILDILNIADNRKEIVYSFVPNSKLVEVKKEIDAFFASNKHNCGIAFSIELSSIVGTKVYESLINKEGR